MLRNLMLAELGLIHGQRDCMFNTKGFSLTGWKSWFASYEEAYWIGYKRELRRQLQNAEGIYVA